MLPRQREMGENTPFTRKCNSESLGTLERVTTDDDKLNLILSGVTLRRNAKRRSSE